MLSTGKKKLAGQIFSIAGVSVGAVILVCLIVHVRRTMDLEVLLQMVRPGWLAAAVLCVCVSQSIDALIFYGMGRSAGCPVRLSGCFDAVFIGEFYYKLGPAGAPVQLKLMYDAGMSVTNTASIFTWKMTANIMVYVAYVAAAILYTLLFRKIRLGGMALGLGLILSLYLLLCCMALLMAFRPEPLLRLIRRILTALSGKIKALRREGRAEEAMRKICEFSAQLRAFTGNPRLFVCLYAGMGLELGVLFSIPYFLYRGLGLSGESFVTLILLQAMVMIISRIVVLPGNVGGAEGSFYLFMGPVFGDHLAVALVLWRMAAFLEVLLLGGIWSLFRFVRRSAAGGRVV